ncbi:hypothetical protein Tco_1456964 [Tanacetum coccineum]
MLSEKDYARDDSNFYGCAGLRLTFDPTKSPYYKVVRAGRNSCKIVIQIYSSESETENRQLTHYKLNIEDHEHPIITTIQIPQDHQQPIITTMLSMIISIRIPHMLHLKGKLFESLGCLVLVRRDCIGSSKFTIYEMREGCSVWSSKYIVNTNDFMNPLPEIWSIRSIVWSILLGEREEDYFLIINLSAKVVQYNLISKTLREIYDMGSSEIADDYLHGFIPPYAISSFDCNFVSLDPRINSRKYTIENSFTLGSTKEADKVKILQSCNGLLLYTGSRRHAFNYVYNPSTNLFKILLEQDYANDDSILYGCAGLRDDFGSSEFTIYEMIKWSSVWSVRYYVNTDDFMTPLPEGWSIRSTVWSTILRERKDDSFLMINLSGKVIEYNLISKNLRDMFDMGSNQVTDDYHDGFIPPFAMYDMQPKQVDHKVYEFIPSYASE